VTTRRRSGRTSGSRCERLQRAGSQAWIVAGGAGISERRAQRNEMAWDRTRLRIATSRDDVVEQSSTPRIESRVANRHHTVGRNRDRRIAIDHCRAIGQCDHDPATASQYWQRIDPNQRDPVHIGARTKRSDELF
jgi:hypothetical protein